MRSEFTVIESWIDEHSRVLDLGCGDGTLLHQLTTNKEVDGLGVEINPDHFDACIEKGLSVINQNVNSGLDNFSSKSFDTVVMTLAIQAMRRPDTVLLETLRIGQSAIVSFPNFGHWRSRLHLLFKGQMPVSEFMPYEWYDTPNIHFCTIKDFEALCHAQGIRIKNRALSNLSGRQTWVSDTMPNWFASTAIYHLTR